MTHMQLNCYLRLWIRSLRDAMQKETKEEMCEAIQMLIQELEKTLKN